METIFTRLYNIMPTYSYTCQDCQEVFELFFYIKDYDPQPVCILCNSKKTDRNYTEDIKTQSTSVKKSDGELKTLGDLAKRNSDRLSDDEKIHLYHKHNEYKFEESTKKLPTGMNRVKKPPKPKWPGHQTKIKRKPKNG